MKKLLIKIFSLLIKQGADKWLHSIVGIIIASLMMLIPLPTIVKIMIAIWTPCVLDIYKELCIDSKFDPIDFIYTFAGAFFGAMVVYVNIIINNLIE